MCRAWWGPQVDNIGAQAKQFFANIETVTFQTKSKSSVINAHELEIGSLWAVSYEGELDNYDRREHKTGEKTVAIEWNSILVVLPLSPEGIWPAPTNNE